MRHQGKIPEQEAAERTDAAMLAAGQGVLDAINRKRGIPAAEAPPESAVEPEPAAERAADPYTEAGRAVLAAIDRERGIVPDGAADAEGEQGQRMFPIPDDVAARMAAIAGHGTTGTPTNPEQEV